MRPTEWRVQIGPAIPALSGELTFIAECGQRGFAAPRASRRSAIKGAGFKAQDVGLPWIEVVRVVAIDCVVIQSTGEAFFVA